MNRADTEYLASLYETYVHGTASRDRNVIEDIFLPDAMMSGLLGDKCVTGSISIFLDDLSTFTVNDVQEYEATLESIAGSRQLATIAFTEHGLKGLTFRNTLVAINNQNQWGITLKYFEAPIPS